MPQEHKDFFVAETKDRALANALRSEICKKYSGVWVCVLVVGDLYKISIANVWGGYLDKEKESIISEFSQKYMNEKLPKEEKKIKKESKKIPVEQKTLIPE